MNDAPAITTTGSTLAYSEGVGALAVDSGLTLTDPDSQIQGATVQISSGFVEAEDALVFANQSGITGNYVDSTGTLTLSGTTTVANYQTALRSVAYENSSDTPSTATRTVTFQATDTGSLPSNSPTRDISVTATNDAPFLTTSAGNTAYTEGDPATTVDSGVTLTDPDDTNIDSGTVRVSANFQPGDVLALPAQPTVTGSYDSGTGVLTLSGSDTKAAYETALRAVTFQSTNTNPTASKTVEFKVNDGDADSNTPTKEITVTPVNSPPAVVAGGTLNYTENDPATAVHSGLTVDDPESNDVTSGSASITANFQSGEDTLAWVDNNGADNIGLDIANSDEQTVVLTGTDTDANYEAALRAVTYVNSSETPSTLARTVTFSATDSFGQTGDDTRTITVAAVDDPPVADADSATVLEDASATSVDVLTNDTDIDGGPKTISSATDPANGTVVLTGGSPGAHTGLTYEPDPDYCNDPPGTTPDTFNYTLNGGSSASVSMTVTCVNDAPVADDETFNGNDSAHGNTTMVVNDPDDGAAEPDAPEDDDDRRHPRGRHRRGRPRAADGHARHVRDQRRRQRHDRVRRRLHLRPGRLDELHGHVRLLRLHGRGLRNAGGDRHRPRDDRDRRVRLVREQQRRRQQRNLDTALRHARPGRDGLGQQPHRLRLRRGQHDAPATTPASR